MNNSVLNSKQLLTLFALAVGFGIAHTQAPLYFSNQHQYFLHGLAAGGMGNLERDWLANTVDPTPVFTAVVHFTYRHLHVWVFQALFFVLLMIYFWSLLSIGSLLIPSGPLRARSVCLLGCMLIVVHAGIARYASVQLWGVDYPWFVHCGIANQYVLGTGLQPSVFGVFLITAVACFAHGRPITAAVVSSIACLFHATYLLPTALLTLGFMFHRWRALGRRAALWHGVLALLLVAPVVIYSLIKFGPTSAEQFREAQKIIAEFRIPHHARIARWFDLIAGLQVAWIGLALLFARRTILLPIMLVPALLSLILTLVQWSTESPMLALLFPWRISAALVPVATVVILARLVALLPCNRWTIAMGVVLALGAVVGGIVVMLCRWGYGTDDRELPALAWVKSNHHSSDVYLIPVRVPAPSSARGVFSTSFTPPPGSAQKHLIAIDLQRFRLTTGVSIYVDYKSIPYKDTDVLEWKRRIEQAVKWYARDWSDPSLLAELREAGITHVLMPANRPKLGDGFELRFDDGYYRIYTVHGGD